MRPALRVDSRGCTDRACGATGHVCMKKRELFPGVHEPLSASPADSGHGGCRVRWREGHTALVSMSVYTVRVVIPGRVVVVPVWPARNLPVRTVVVVRPSRNVPAPGRPARASAHFPGDRPPPLNGGKGLGQPLAIVLQRLLRQALGSAAIFMLGRITARRDRAMRVRLASNEDKDNREKARNECPGRVVTPGLASRHHGATSPILRLVKRFSELMRIPLSMATEKGMKHVWL